MKKFILILVIGLVSLTGKGQDTLYLMQQIDSLHWEMEDSVNWHYQLQLAWCEEEECDLLKIEWREAVFSIRMQRLRAIRRLLGLPEE